MRLSLKSKISILVTLALVMGIVYGGIYINRNIERAAKSKDIVTKTELFKITSELIHQLQIERGKTSLFLNKQISNTELQDQYKTVDGKIAFFQAQLKISTSESNTQLIEDIKSIRETTKSNTEANKVIALYREKIMSLINSQVQISKNTILDGLEMQLLGINMLELAKEYTGRTRANMTPLLAAKKPLNVKQITFLQDLQSRINSNLQSPIMEISKAGKEKVDHFITSPNWKKVVTTFEMVAQESSTGNFTTEPQDFFKDITSSIDSMSEIINLELENVKGRSNEIYNSAMDILWMNVIILGIALLAVGVISWFIIKGITTPIYSAVDSLNEAAGSISLSSGQVTQASHQVSAGAVESASALEEIVASIEELNSIVKQNADRAGSAAQLSSQGRNSAELGHKEMANLIKAMKEIASSSHRIEEIINVIDDIAFQTNLLALNASVEAARAGEQGKGFAVVAEAVRALAQRSAVAAKDIGGLIKESAEQVEKGTHVAASSETSLNSIVDIIKKIAVLNEEISAASNEQSLGIQQISKAMNELDTSTQSNASVAEEVSASAEQMNNQVTNIGKLVTTLQKIVEGGT